MLVREVATVPVLFSVKRCTKPQVCRCSPPLALHLVAPFLGPHVQVLEYAEGGARGRPDKHVGALILK